MKGNRQLSAATGWASALTVAILGFYGGYLRMWMSDDGLIVLRTVRNLLAGNGPVFNAGERVETNTSTLWQYIIYLGALVTDLRLENIALGASLVFTALALFIGTLATARAVAPGHLVLPFGLLFYVALPPARDFATSGLEWGLSIFWVAVQWALLLLWAGKRYQRDWPLYVLAFWSGLSWLVRPELALYGGITGLVLLIAARDLKVSLKILAAALPVPTAYQIFRMGYYGLLVPQTAVAKSASDTAWGTGWDYLMDFAQPYHLIVPAVIALLGGALMLLRPRTEAGQGLRCPAAAVAVMIGCAVLHVLYVLRVGGDFMHARMLLIPLFALLLPVAVVPVASISKGRLRMGAAGALGLVVFACGLAWQVTVATTDSDPIYTEHPNEQWGIVNERSYWLHFAGQDRRVRYAEDYLAYRNMQDWHAVLDHARERNDAQMVNILLSQDPDVVSWESFPRAEDADTANIPLTVWMVNLGMTSMNAPLDVRVLDNMGLANPLAARQPRIPDGRVGHDKELPIYWQLADSGADPEQLPAWVKPEKVAPAREALHTEPYRELFASYREPMSAKRFLANLRFALGAGRTLQFEGEPEDVLRTHEADMSQPISWPVEAKLDPQR